jgi:CHAD domain-containing protein
MMAEGSPGFPFAELAIDLADSINGLLVRRKNRHLAIHAARKSIRRLRSVFDLCGKALGPEVEGIDRQYKRIAASLSTLRDAQVVANTAGLLAKAEGDGPWQDVYTGLKRRRNVLLAKALGTDPEFAKRRKQLDALAKAVRALHWNDLGIDQLRKRIARSERRVAKAERASVAAPSAVHRHRWRRRLRRLRMQRQAIQTVAKSAPALKALQTGAGHASIKTLSKRSDDLGRQQDLQMLRRSLTALDKSLPLAMLCRGLRVEIERTSPCSARTPRAAKEAPAQNRPSRKSTCNEANSDPGGA